MYGELKVLLENADKAVNCTIGIYPKTVAKHVFLSDGTNIEDATKTDKG